MDHLYDDTIFSLATGIGRSATAMIRISGPEVENLSSIFGFDMPEPKVAKLRILTHKNQRLDQSIILFLKDQRATQARMLWSFIFMAGEL